MLCMLYAQGVLPYLGIIGRFRGNDPRFGDFQSDYVPILHLCDILYEYICTWRLVPLPSTYILIQDITPQYNPIDPFCLQKKIGLSLSHLVLEILGPKLGKFFQQNVLFNRFHAFCINFLLDFQPNWPPFSLILELFDRSFSHKLRSDLVQFFFSCWTQLLKIWGRPPPPPLYAI